MQKIAIPIVVVSVLLLGGYFLYTNNQDNEGGLTIINEGYTIKDMTADPQSIELAIGEEATYGDLKITHLGGGHRITTEHKDLSFAKLSLETPDQTPETINISTETVEEHKFQGKLFANYQLVVEDVGWNGKTVKFKIVDMESAVSPNVALSVPGNTPGDLLELPITFDLKNGDVKKVKDLTITNLGFYDEATEANFLVRASDVALETQSEPRTIVRVTNPLNGELSTGLKFANYLIYTEMVSPQGEMVRLRVEANEYHHNPDLMIKDPVPSVVKLKENETKMVDGLTIFNEVTGNKTMNTGESRLFAHVTFSTPQVAGKKFYINYPFFNESGEVEFEVLSFADYQIRVVSITENGKLELFVNRK
jgi:hypothetical protein